MRHLTPVNAARFMLTLVLGALTPGATTFGAAPGPEAQPTDFTKQVAELAKKLGASPSGVPGEAEVRLCMLPPAAFPAIEKAAGDESLPAPARDKLQEIVKRERHRLAARLRRQKVRDEEVEWNVRTALAAYENAGKHDAKWDDLAREGIRLAAAWPEAGPSAFIPPAAVAPQDARVPLEKAVAAGCDDPFVLYLLARIQEVSGSVEPMVRLTLQSKSADEMLLSQYPAYRKEWAVVRCYVTEFRLGSANANARGLDHFDRATSSHLNKLSQAMVKLFPRVCKDGAPPERLYDIAEHILDLHQYSAQGLDEIYGKLAPTLEKGVGPGPLALKAQFYVTFAWQARGAGWAANITPEGHKLMMERLALASEAAQKAYEIDPNDPHAATVMLTVELGQGKGRPVMEKWFERAMAADPDNLDACERKITYLLPRWYGSAEELLQFGQDCYEEGNWRGGLPLLLARVHETISDDAADKRKYLSQPLVWEDFVRVYEPYLSARPNDLKARSRYCSIASTIGKWAVAHKQFELLGDNVVLEPFGSSTNLNTYRDLARKGAANSRL
ncbi:MAG: hypothetical protein JWL69_2686 [Phycisphaerales bacterium]|nr:hypothetical protein [Phycisphaerales bacterium]